MPAQRHSLTGLLSTSGFAFMPQCVDRSQCPEPALMPAFVYSTFAMTPNLYSCHSSATVLFSTYCSPVTYCVHLLYKCMTPMVQLIQEAAY